MTETIASSTPPVIDMEMGKEGEEQVDGDVTEKMQFLHRQAKRYPVGSPFRPFQGPLTVHCASTSWQLQSLVGNGRVVCYVRRQA
eukprot:1360611-Amphidinium_carterae.1